MNRADALARLRAQVKAGQPIIGAGAGTGLSAKCAEAGGGDLIIIYNSGRYRMAGRGSLAGLLPYGDANAIVVDMAREVLPVVRETPVLAGVCGTDPFRLMPVFLEEIRRIGFSGEDEIHEPCHVRARSRQSGRGFDPDVGCCTPATKRDSRKQTKRRGASRHPNLITQQLRAHAVGVALGESRALRALHRSNQRGAAYSKSTAHIGVSEQCRLTLAVR